MQAISEAQKPGKAILQGGHNLEITGETIK